MSQLGVSFLTFLNAQPPGWIYFFLFLGAFMENITPPIPGDMLIVFGAYLAGVGIIGLWPAYFVMWAGSALGCMVVYGVSFWKGRDWILHLGKPFVTVESLDKAEVWFQRYGDKIVVFNRFMPTVRMFVGVVAGVSRMHPVRMTLYVVLGTFLWNSILVYFGVTVGENWQVVIDVMNAYNRVLMGLMVAGGVGYWFWRRKQKSRHGQDASDPMDRQV
ncbi:MAG: DedA family protein [bacterium]|nr:DedA family protein [bacterium]